MNEIRMFVNGQAMRGGSLANALDTATFIGPAITAARYRFYSVRDEFPGLYPAESGGQAVPGELYAMSYTTLREQLLPREPVELELTVIELDDGNGSLSMQIRTDARNASGVVDISNDGGWRAYLSRRH